MEAIQAIDLAKVLQWIGAIGVLLHALIAVFMLIPGEQPEKFLQAIVDFIEKFSRK